MDQLAPPQSEAEILRELRNRARLQEIVDLRLTEPDVAELLRDVCELVCRELKLPIGLVTVLLDDTQLFAAQVGLDGWMAEAGGTPVEWSFCRFPVTSKTAFTVTDATRHAFVRANPLVTIDGVRCYAGWPLVSARGHALGTLCVAGPDVRVFGDADLAFLRSCAAEVMTRLEARRGGTV